MDSITVGWRKQLPNTVEVSNKKTRSQKLPGRKMPPPKRQEISPNPQPHVPRRVKFDTLPTEIHPYAPLSTISLASKSSDSSTTIVPIQETERFCSVRAGIATFAIIIIIILAAGTSVGIVFATTTSQNPSGSGKNNNNNNNNNNNQNSFFTISPVLLTSSIGIGNQIGLPCSGYTTINDPTRNATIAGSSSACDNGQPFNTINGGAWIRFVGIGGTTIPLSSPGVDHCGAVLSSWYNDTLPITMNVTTNGTVCFETYAYVCGYSVDVSVVYCPGNYYVYFLPPVGICNARYCTD